MQKEFTGIAIVTGTQCCAIEAPGCLLEFQDQASPDTFASPAGADEDLVDPKVGREGGESHKTGRLSHQSRHQSGLGAGHVRGACNPAQVGEIRQNERANEQDLTVFRHLEIAS